MKILFLTQLIPYPPDAGPRVKTWHVLRYLASRGHQVTLASFVRPEETVHIDKLKEVCAQVYTVPIRRSRWFDILYWLRSNLSGRPFLIERDDIPEMRSLVARLVQQENFDAIHVDQVNMAQFALPFSSNHETGGDNQFPSLVFDAHNAVWTILERMQKNTHWYLKPVAALESRRMKHYEGMVIRRFHHTLSVTEPDRTALLKAVASTSGGGSADVQNHIQQSLVTIPIAVDTRALQPVKRRPGLTSLVTLGTLFYPPNADGIRWFLREVLPLIRQEIPDTCLTIIGKNPPADFIKIAAQNPEVVRVTGYVQDLVPYLEDAAIMVVPLRSGGGMRVRILEAFAQAMPVVTTTVGLEGIDAVPGEDVLVGDTPDSFAAEVVRLMKDPQLQSSLASNGRRLAERSYDWQAVLKKLDRVYDNTGQKEHQAIAYHA